MAVTLWTDLRELKKRLEIHPENTTQDWSINWTCEIATEWLEEWLGRAGRMAYRERTGFYGGSGTQNLLLPARPVYVSPTPRVWVDRCGYWGSASGSFGTEEELEFGVDFALNLDQDDTGVSRSGILVRINEVWEKPTVRQRGYLSPFIGQSNGNVKVTYTAGYTIDTLPAPLRLAAVTLAVRLHHFFPLGLELNSESYEDRNISWAAERKDYLMGVILPMIQGFRNRRW